MTSRMCHHLGLFFFLCVSGMASFAQVGLKVGMGVCDIAFVKYGQTPYLGYDVNDLEHRNPMITCQAGAVGTFGLGRRVKLQSELLYVRQGLDYSTQFLYGDIFYKIKIDYLQAPVLVNYNIAPKKKRPLWIVAGPYLAWKLNVKRLTEVLGRQTNTAVPNVKNMDLGIIGGLALDFHLSSGNTICVEWRTSFSLVNMMKPVEGYLYNYEEGPEKKYARNVCISFLVGYKFRIEKQDK